MRRIHLQESFPTPSSVQIKVDGVLDIEALQILEELCLRHMGEQRDIYLDLNGVIHLGREARRFLKTILPQVKRISLPSSQLL